MDKIKSQKQLNIQTEDRWDASCIHVDVPSLQKEDYQLQMLQNLSLIHISEPTRRS